MRIDLCTVWVWDLWDSYKEIVNTGVFLNQGIYQGQEQNESGIFEMLNVR
mgnify:CR=1 FL=1